MARSAPSPVRTDPSSPTRVRLELRCLHCGRSATHELRHPTFCTRPLVARVGAVWPEGWDGFFTPTPVTCPHCGAVDEYELTPSTMMEAMGEDGRIATAVPGLSDGTVCRRPTAAVAHLRAAAEAAPADGSRWRRLGNLCYEGGQVEEAFRWWSRALDEDPDEVNAAFNLAMCAAEDGQDELAGRLAMAALARSARPPGDPPRLAADRINALVSLLRDFGPADGAIHMGWRGEQNDRQAIVHLSSARLDRLERWDRLARALVELAPFHVAFGPDTLDEDEGRSQLEEWIDGPDPDGGGLERAWPDLPVGRPVGQSERQQRKKKRKAERNARRANRRR